MINLPRLYTSSDFDECISLLLQAYNIYPIRELCPPKEIAETYFRSLVGNPGAHTFVYDIHNKVYAVCSGTIKEDDDGSGLTVKRFYVEDVFSERNTQKKMKLEERIFEFGKGLLSQDGVGWVFEKKDFIKHRSRVFNKIGFDPAANERKKIDKEYACILKNWSKVKDVNTGNRKMTLPEIFQMPARIEEINYNEFRVYAKSSGLIKITTGLIVVGDLFSDDSLSSPLHYTFPIGEFPTELLMAKKGEHFERPAAANVKFSNEEIHSWELAVPMGSNLTKLAKGDICGYGVDTGQAWITDLEALKCFRKKEAEDSQYAAGFRTDLGAIFPVDDLNIFIFTTGHGDGHYASYIGRDKKGNVCRLMTEFEVFTEGEYEDD